MLWAILLLALIIALDGCSAADEVPPDAGADAAEGCAPGELPVDGGGCQSAGLPRDMPCPPGEVPSEGMGCRQAGVPPASCGHGFVPAGDGACHPVLPDSACLPGQMAIPGEAECHDVAPCGAGPFDGIPVDGSTLFVRADYAGTDSDGSEAHPYTTIAAAVSAAVPGALVAVAKGVYQESVLIQGKAVRVWGACPGAVEVRMTSSGSAAFDIRTGADGSEIHTLSVSGPGIGVMSSGSLGVILDHLWIHDLGVRGVNVQRTLGDTDLTVRASLVERATAAGIFVAGSAVSIVDTVVRRTKSGRGVGIQPSASTGERASVTVRSSVLEDNTELGAYVSGSDFEFVESVVRGTVSLPDGSSGFGLALQEDPGSGERTKATVRGSIADRNQSTGIYVRGSDVVIEDTVVRETKLAKDGTKGEGVAVENALDSNAAPATVTLRDSTIEQNHEIGVFVAGARAVIEGVIVRGTLPAAAIFGRGINVRDDPEHGQRSQVEIRSSVIERNAEIGVFVGGSDAILEAIAVRDTATRADGTTGQGIVIQDIVETGQRANVTVQSSIVERNREVGVFVGGADATILDSVIRDTMPNDDDDFGRGVGVQDHPMTAQRAMAAIRRCLIERSNDFGVLVSGSDVVIDHVLVRETQPVKPHFGDGVAAISLTNSASLDISATRIESSARAGLASFGATLSMESTEVVCSAFDLDGETFDNLSFEISATASNSCGCPDVTRECHVVSAGIEPPAPLPEP